MILPFWNSELYVEISSWFPFGKDYHLSSLNRFFNGTLRHISEACLDLDSEFFFMASPLTGCVGNLSRENFFKYSPDKVLNLGFLITLGYSEKIERAVIGSLMFGENGRNLLAGITNCSLWSRGIFEGSSKVIAIASNEPFFDCMSYLSELSAFLDTARSFADSWNNAYYAGKFGYDRFFMSWENEEPYDAGISRILAELEYDGTKEIAGGSSVIEFPPFLGTAVSFKELNESED